MDKSEVGSDERPWLKYPEGQEVQLILGPPGCGKTTSLLTIVQEELAAGVPKDRIIFCSFTTAACNEARDRALVKFKGRKEDFKYFRTIHSLCYQAVGIKRNQVMMRRDYRLFGEKIDCKFLGHISPDMQHSDDVYLMADTLYRNNRKAAYDLLQSEELDLNKLKQVRKWYKEFKTINNKVDFTDMLELFVKRGEPIEDVDVAIIDEAQDLSTLQWRALWVMLKKCKRIYIAFDDLQEIHGWAGADIETCLSLVGTKPIKVLGHSYRLPAAVLDYANKVSDLIDRKFDREFTPREAEGAVDIVNYVTDVRFDPKKSYLVLARTNAWLDRAEEAMRAKGLTYIRKGKHSFSAADLKLIEKYEALRASGEPVDPNSALAMVVKDAYDPNAPWYDSLSLSDNPEDMDYLRDLVERGVDVTKKPNIELSTIHSAKGREADVVVLLLDLSYKAHRNLMLDTDAELKVLYVGVTRAKEHLILVAPQGRHSYPNLIEHDSFAVSNKYRKAREKKRDARY